MRILTPIRALSTAVALVFLVGCAGGSAVAPKPSTPQSHARSLMSRIPVALTPIGMLKVNVNTGYHFRAFDHCPAAGPIEYISDFNNSVINIYKGPFAGQAPCGQLTKGVLNPQGMFVRESTHELYVANTGDGNILVFRRGAATPFKTYTDPSGQFPLDVTIAKDGIVIATNIFGTNTEAGSLSTWRRDGTFVGNFPNAKGAQDYYLTVQKDGTVYFDDNSFNKAAQAAATYSPTSLRTLARRPRALSAPVIRLHSISTGHNITTSTPTRQTMSVARSNTRHANPSAPFRAIQLGCRSVLQKINPKHSK
jgi:hypothetical protein